MNNKAESNKITINIYLNVLIKVWKLSTLEWVGGSAGVNFPHFKRRKEVS